MDNQGEKFTPGGANQQAPNGAIPSVQPPNQNESGPQDGTTTPDGNVAQHILGGIDKSSGQSTTTVTPPAESTVERPTDVSEPFVMPGSTTISSADVVSPEEMPESSPGEAARIHAALGHPYFSNGSTQSSVRETGDIVIGGPTKSRKLPRAAVFGLIGLVVAVLLISGIVMAISGVFGDGSQFVVEQDIESAFNRYANYYLFGEEASTPLEGEWDRERLYAAEKAILDNDQNFFLQAKIYFDEYESLYDKANAQQDNVTDSEDTPFVESLIDAFNFLYLYSQTDFFDDSELLQIYTDSGATTAYGEIENRYNTLANTNYQLQKDFAEKRILYDSAQIDRLEIYSQSGCLTGDGSFVDEDSCVVDLSSFDTKRIEKSYEISDSLSSIPQDVAREIAHMLYIMANQGLYK